MGAHVRHWNFRPLSSEQVLVSGSIAPAVDPCMTVRKVEVLIDAGCTSCMHASMM